MRQNQLPFTVILLTLFLLSCCSANAEKYQYSDDAARERKKLEDERKVSVIGKKFWILPKPNALGRVQFYEEPSILAQRFIVSEKAAFEVQANEGGFFKVVFDDGKKAFLPVFELGHRVNHDPTTYDLNESYFERIYEEDPDVIRPRLKKREMEESRRITAERQRKKKAAAERKARGGVKLGMTKEEVLRSSWGKPLRTNRTILRGLVHEQWVYDGGFLYFENDILTAIQN